MHYQLATDLPGLSAYIDRFSGLAGGNRWVKRAVQLAQDASRSPFQAKIVADYHWLEMALSHQMVTHEHFGRLVPEEVDLKSLAALQFAGTTVEVHRRLTSRGRTVLEGRIRDSLKAQSGFASLYLEMEMVQLLMAAGYNVELPDFDGTEQYDLRFNNATSSGEVECKSLSMDAGRKIHRKDFYRLIDKIGSTLADRATDGRNEILIITLDNRLPRDTASQSELRAATLKVADNQAPTSVRGPFFHVERCQFEDCLPHAPLDSEAAFYKACREAFGQNCHVSGAMTPRGKCLVVMRSQREDDHSKPLLAAMRSAASQLSGKSPGFIVVQFDDIDVSDLLSPHLRRRMGILSHALFLQYGALHVTATYFCVYGGLARNRKGIGAPAFAVPNPQPKLKTDAIDARTFLNNVSDAEFAELLGAPLPAESISSIPISKSDA